eukprot:GFUD01029904.1.p1 GENE.GFUD01029904.1~~GFUD01029904.1.p1  ORF type:complete len:125 (+),score=28.22 GFUD01029904.1:34-408(+)
MTNVRKCTGNHDSPHHPVEDSAEVIRLLESLPRCRVNTKPVKIFTCFDNSGNLVSVNWGGKRFVAKVTVKRKVKKLKVNCVTKYRKSHYKAGYRYKDHQYHQTQSGSKLCRLSVVPVKRIKAPP